MIWTTTPWTLPANQCVCYSPTESYSLVNFKGDHFIVSTARIQELTASDLPDIQVIESFPATKLEGLKYIHPMNGKALPLIPSTYVTMNKGTGLLHSAPNHGKEDYSISIQSGIKLDPCLVNEEGCFNDSTGEALKDKFVLTDGSEAVLNLLRNNVVCLSKYTHSYPLDWRSKKPVIIIPSRQWFLDVDSIRDDCLKALESVSIPSGDKFFRNELIARPPWCISRQRVWGTPIPVFYDPEGKAVLSKSILESVTKIFKSKGVNSWWSLSADDLLPQQLKGKNLVKGTDILDIWFDSGVTWANVLPTIDSTADLYLEGHDQFRGWFQSSLVTKVASSGKPISPYKRIFLHGFVLDEEGRKMSKSEGNVVDPMDLVNGNNRSIKPIEAYGSDVLRWWVFKYANSSKNVLFSMNQMDSSKDDVTKVRKTIRFILGSLSDFKVNEREDVLDLIRLTTDQMMLNHIHTVISNCHALLEEYNYETLFTTINNLIHEDLSAEYFSAVKNRLYCWPQMSQERRSVQALFWILLPNLTRILAPILPHTFTDAFKYYPQDLKGIENNVMFMHDRWDVSPGHNSDDSLKMTKLLSGLRGIKRRLNQALPSTNTKLFSCKITVDSEEWLVLLNELTHQELCDYLSLASVEVVYGDVQSNLDMTEEEGQETFRFNINVDKTSKNECPRCRNYVSSEPNQPCAFCSDILRDYFQK